MFTLWLKNEKPESFFFFRFRRAWASFEASENSGSSHCQWASNREDAVVISNFWCFGYYSDQFLNSKWVKKENSEKGMKAPEGLFASWACYWWWLLNRAVNSISPLFCSLCYRNTWKPCSAGVNLSEWPLKIHYSGLHSQRKIDRMTTNCLAKVILSWGAQQKWALVEAGRSGERWRHQLSWLRCPGGKGIFINLVILQDRKRHAWSKLDLEKPVHQVEKRAFFGPEKQELWPLSYYLKSSDHIVFKWLITT